MASFNEHPKAQAILQTLEGQDSVQILKNLFVEFTLFKEESRKGMRDVTVDVNKLSKNFADYKEDMDNYKKELDEERQENKVTLDYQDKKITDLEEKLAGADSRIKILEGVVRKQENEMQQIKESVTDLKSRSMSNNVLLHKIPESDKETKQDLTGTVKNFFVNEMKMQCERVEKIKFQKIHRIGRIEGRKEPRSIVININSEDDRSYIFAHSKNLDKNKYGISGQHPPEIGEKRYILKQALKTDELKNKQCRLSQDKLFVSGKEFIPGCISPRNSPEGYDASTVDWCNIPKIHQSRPVTDSGNSFVSYSAKIGTKKDAGFIIDMIKGMQRENPATHLAYAYRLEYGLGSGILEFLDDDGEWGLGRRILGKMQTMNKTGVIVVSARWYAAHIGPKRFNHYLDTAEEALMREQIGPAYRD